MAGPFPGDYYGGRFSERDRAIAIGTMMGEAWQEGLEGMAAVADVIANRVVDPSFEHYGKNITGQAYRASEFSTWSKNERAAYATATKAAFSPEKLSPAEKKAYQQAQIAFDKVFVDGSLRGIARGATFYHNPEVTAKLGTNAFHNRLESRYGGMDLGNHRFTGPNFGRPEVYTAPYSAAGYYNNTPAEILAAERNMAAQREVFRGPSDYGPPVWDGTTSPEPTLAAPVGAVSASDVAPLGLDFSAGLDAANAGYSAPVDFSGGLEAANAGYTEPDRSFGSPLADRVAPSVAPMDVGPANPTQADMGSYFSGAPLGPAQSFGDFNPGDVSTFAGGTVSGGMGGDLGQPMQDTLAVAGPNLTGENFSFGFGTPTGAPVSDQPMSYDRSAMATGWGYRDSPGFSEALATLGPQGISAPVGPEVGTILGTEMVAGMDNRASYSPSQQMGRSVFSGPAREAPQAAPSVVPYSEIAPSLTATPYAFAAMAPSYTMPSLTQAAPRVDDLPSYPLTPPSLVPQLPALAPPTEVRAAPKVAAPRAQQIERPQAIESFAPSERSAPEKPATGLDRFNNADSFLGGFLGGDRLAIADLSRATGRDYTGLGMMAMGSDHMAQPAMLGLGNAYAEATGQQGYRGLFDGLFDGWGGGGGWGTTVGRGVGAVAGGALAGIPGAFVGGYLGGMAGDAISPTNNWGTGGLYDPGPNGGTGGLYDPRGPQDRGLFDGFFGGFGWGGGGGYNDGLGNTPGAGGLY